MRREWIAGIALGMALSGCSSNSGTDAGPNPAQDSGPADSGPAADSGPTDAGPTDAGPADAGSMDAGQPDSGPIDAGTQDAGPTGPATMSNIQHLVVIIQENHSFDSYFGLYCTAPTGSDPTCTAGPSCCEEAPALDPIGTAPTELTDAENGTWDPLHLKTCEVPEIDDGGMDRYAKGSPCANHQNVAYANIDGGTTVNTYWTMAGQGALADRYFQSVVGESSSNDMYFARASFVFLDNSYEPLAKATQCANDRGIGLPVPQMDFPGATIGDLMSDAGVPWAFYAEGYNDGVAAWELDGGCAAVPQDCPDALPGYPCNYDPSDVPFLYYASLDESSVMRDLSQLSTDLNSGAMPSVVYVKGLGYHSEHPGVGTTISAGEDFVSSVVQQIQSSPYAASTLIIVTPDESGGYFDHISPPGFSSVDGQQYGPRVWTLALGPFVQANSISHTQLEHSSIVKFIEWNWLGGATGQLGERDAMVNNLGSLLDPTKTGTPVPAGP